jgi:hypothetical protein
MLYQCHNVQSQLPIILASKANEGNAGAADAASGPAARMEHGSSGPSVAKSKARWKRKSAEVENADPHAQNVAKKSAYAAAKGSTRALRPKGDPVKPTAAAKTKAAAKIRAGNNTFQAAPRTKTAAAAAVATEHLAAAGRAASAPATNGDPGPSHPSCVPRAPKPDLAATPGIQPDGLSAPSAERRDLADSGDLVFHPPEQRAAAARPQHEGTAADSVAAAGKGITPQSGGRESRRVPSRLQPWACELCTFENQGSAARCGMCEAGRSGRVATPAVNLAGVCSSPGAIPMYWHHLFGTCQHHSSH